jgi:DNA polymerase III subunit delta'
MEKGNSNKKSGWPLAGNRPVTDFLEKSVANGRIADTYIFLGPRDLGKTAAAVFFSASLLCQKKKTGVFSPPCGECPSCRQMSNKGGGEESGFETLHGDFHLIKREKDKKNISIEQIREFVRILGMSSFLNSYKVGVIKDAEDLSEGAANALLKTLEEPRPKVIVILTVCRLERLPATIISRSQVLNFLPVESGVIYNYLIEKFDCPRARAKGISRLSLGRPALAAKFFEDEDFHGSYLEKAEMFLDFFKKDANGRIAAVEKIVGGREEDDKADKALNILSIWQGVIRDFLLLESGAGDLIQHEELRKKFDGLKAEAGGARWLKACGLLKLGEKYLRANVNPKLVLENIAINI